MSTEVDIRIGAQATPVGTLVHEERNAKQISYFRYDESWINNPMGFPLAPDMPFEQLEFYTAGDRNISCIPAPLADATPDSWGRRVIEVLLGSRYLNDLDYLTETDDYLRSGALRIFTKDGTPIAQPRENGIRIPNLHKLDDMIVKARAFEDDPENYARQRATMMGGDVLQEIIGSLGGARPKINARDNDGSLWIAKLPKRNDDYSVERVEVMTLKLARMVNISASEARIINTERNLPVSIIKRFDRIAQNGKAPTRIPYISAQTFLGLRGTEPGSYDEIANQIRSHGSTPGKDIPELYRRLMFSVLIRNTDDHLRNHGFLRAKSGWRLSKAFDVNPSPTHGARLQTSISEIHGNMPSLEAVIDASELFDIAPTEAEIMAGRMATTIQDNWHQIAHEVGMTQRDKSVVSHIFSNPDLDNAASLASRSGYTS